MPGLGRSQLGFRKRRWLHLHVVPWTDLNGVAAKRQSGKKKTFRLLTFFLTEKHGTTRYTVIYLDVEISPIGEKQCFCVHTKTRCESTGAVHDSKMPIPNQGTVSMFDRAVCFQIAGRCRWCGQLRLGAESSQCWTEIMMTHDLYQRPLASKTFWVRALWRPEAVYQTPFNFPPQAWNTTFCVKVLVRWVCLKFTFSCARLLPRTRTKQFWSVRDFLQKWNWKLRDSCKKWSLWCGVGCCSYRSFSTQNSKPSFDILWERERRKRMLDKTWSSPWQHVGHQKSIDMFAPLWLCDYMWLHVIFFNDYQ